jgi:hypothetical protein
MDTLVRNAKLLGDVFQRITALTAFDDLLVSLRFCDVFACYGGFWRILKRIKPLQNACNGFF